LDIGHSLLDIPCWTLVIQKMMMEDEYPISNTQFPMMKGKDGNTEGSQHLDIGHSLLGIGYSKNDDGR